MPNKQGITARQQWEASVIRGESERTEFEPEEIPFQLSYLWRWFKELHTSRQIGPRGALPISYSDMLAWSQLTQRPLQQFDIITIRKLDDRFFYVLRTPEGAAPQFHDDAKATQAVKEMLRSMAKKPNSEGPGLAELKVPDKKEIQYVPVKRKSKNG
jgi:hypothetical protein